MDYHNVNKVDAWDNFKETLASFRNLIFVKLVFYYIINFSVYNPLIL